MSKLWVDPPEGWKYGFPAIYDAETDGQMSEWIVRKGYPLLTIKEYGEQWHIRCWPAEEPEKYPDKDISAQKPSEDVKNAPIGTDLPKKTHRKVTVSEVLEELNFAKLRIQELRDRIDVLEKDKNTLAQPEQDEVDIRSRLYQRIHELETQLAQPEQEPVAWMDEDGDVLSASIVDGKGLRNIPLYTNPPQRTWVGLTDDEMLMIYGQKHEGKKYSLGRMVQAKLKEKNT